MAADAAGELLADAELAVAEEPLLAVDGGVLAPVSGAADRVAVVGVVVLARGVGRAVGVGVGVGCDVVVGRAALVVVTTGNAGAAGLASVAA